MPRHIAMQNTPPVMGNHEEAVQDPEGKCRNSEEVHCRDGLAMILQESLPAVRRPRVFRRLLNPTRDSSLCDIKSKFQQFPMDACRAPSWVFCHHAENQLSQLVADPLAAKDFSIAGKPTPIETETGSMPAHHGFRRNEDESRLPLGPKTPRHQPE